MKYTIKYPLKVYRYAYASICLPRYLPYNVFKPFSILMSILFGLGLDRVNQNNMKISNFNICTHDIM